MCLRLNTKERLKINEPIQAYKVYRLLGESSSPLSGHSYKISSYYQSHNVLDCSPGDTLTSDRGTVELTDSEISCQRVANGIHCFTSPSAIKHFVEINKAEGAGFIVFAIEVAPEDFVAYGSWEGHEDYTNVVAHRIKILHRENLEELIKDGW